VNLARRAWCMPFLLGCAAFAPSHATGCASSAEDMRFDAADCLVPRANPAHSNASETVLQNRCDAPLAMLIVICDLAAQPACKSDPLFSRGWSAYRGVEFVAAARPRAGSLATHREAGGDPPLATFVPGLQRGRRAQIAACRLELKSSLSQDPCVVRLVKLKSAIDASDGKSLRAALARHGGMLTCR
jgi:hypothetical protein